MSLGGTFQAAGADSGLSARGKLPFRQGPKLAERVGHAIAAEAEAVFDVQGQVHPLQAVEPEPVQERLGGILFGRKRPLQPLFDHLVDRADRGRPDLGQIDLAGLDQHGILVLPRAEEKAEGHERRLLRPAAVVPLFQERIELVAGDAGQAAAVDPLDGHGHVPPRQEDEQCGEDPAQGPHGAAFQVRMLARVGHREDAAPHAASADQDDVGLRAAFQELGHGPRGADFLDPPPLGPAGRIDQETLAAVQPRGDGVEHRQRLFTGVAALFFEVRHLNRVDQPHERIEQRLAVHARGDDRPHPARNADVRQHQRRIDQPRVIGHHQRRAAEVAEFLQSFHADPVAEPGEEADQHPVAGPDPLHGCNPFGVRQFIAAFNLILECGTGWAADAGRTTSSAP